MSNHTSVRTHNGFVALVGAGPGDPDLITLKGVKHLRRADVVLIDALAAPELLEHCPPDVRVVHVGKRMGQPSTPQDLIERMLIEEAERGHYVVRLKGGDPYVFGRGGEEALALSAANIPYALVPGLSSALSVPACSGIPVTHRGVSQSVTIVTASSADNAPRLAKRWAALAAAGGTLVFLMARTKAAAVQKTLVDAGLAAKTPCAMIERGTTADERVVEAPLSDIADAVADAQLSAHALLVVGDAVSLRTDILPQAAHDALAPAPHHPSFHQRR